MDKKTIARMIVFVLAWVNTFLSAHNYKTIPVVDDAQVALWIAFAISAYEWIKHSYKWVMTNWIKKQSAPVPVLPASNPTSTPTAVDTTVNVPTAEAQTVQSTTLPESNQQ